MTPRIDASRPSFPPGAFESSEDATDSARLAQIGHIAAAFRIQALRPKLEALEESLRESDLLDIVVMGQFKAGKSSLLNWVCGRDVLPVDVLPATAVITRILFGSSERAIVRYAGGRAEPMLLEQIGKFVTEQENPMNAKSVTMVDIELSELDRFRGLRFVDTPGLGSVFEHNTRASIEWLPRVGAVLLAISVDHPLSERDLDLLAQLRAHTPEIAVLLTKADLVTGAELERVVGFVRDQLKRHLDVPPKVLPFSTRPGFDAARSGLVSALLDLARDSTRAAGGVTAHKLRVIAGDLRKYLVLAQQAAVAEEGAREALLRAIEAERSSLQGIINEIWLLAGDIQGRLRSAFEERFLCHHHELVDVLRGGLRDELPKWAGDLRKLTSTFEAWLGGAFTKELQAIDAKEAGNSSEPLEEAKASFSRIAQAFQDRLSRRIEEALHVPFTGAVFEARLTPPASPDVRIGRVFDSQIQSLWFLIPTKLVRPLVDRHFMRMLSWEAKKNLYRLSAQWSDAVARPIDLLAGQTRDFIADELAAVAAATDRPDEKLGDIQKALEELETIEQLQTSTNTEARNPGSTGNDRG